MGNFEFVIMINAATILILTVMALLLCFAARFKGESSYATLIIILSSLPIYIYNVCRSLGWYEVAIYLAPTAFSVNLTLMPLLWLLVLRGFNPNYRFSLASLLHFVPALLSIGLFCGSVFSLPADQRYNFMIFENRGVDSWISDTNYILLLAQLVGYFIVIFRYLHKVRHYVHNHYSEAELQRKVWIPRFISLLALMFVVVVICQVIWPQSEKWLMQTLNVVAMGYMLYAELENAFSAHHKQIFTTAVVTDAEADFIETEVKNPIDYTRKDNNELLSRQATQVVDYLTTSEAYSNPDLSLNDVATALGISPRTLSKAINVILEKNFFDLINGFRVEKSKNLLLNKKELRLTLETIAEQCGFNSRVTFNNAFKKVMGLTTTEWLKLNK